MNEAYADNDRATFGKCLPGLRAFYDGLHVDVEDDGDISWTDALIEQLWPRWCAAA